MKKMFALLLCTAAVCPAAVIPFGLSPSGTDVAVGLSPSNEVPAVTNSTGSGGPISGGILFNTDTRVLALAIGYGSAAGFTALTGPATSLTISGPAGTNQTAGVLVDLSPLSFATTNPAAGGLIFGSVNYPTNLVTDLLAGRDYVNIGTATNPAGEIRGQLIPLQTPPTVTCPAPSTVECGTPATVAVQVGDTDGDALRVVWSVNGDSVQTNLVAGGLPPTSASVPLIMVLPLGTNVVAVVVTDSATNAASCSTVVTVVDTIPPVIQSASATPNVLWPPNHNYVNVTLKAVVQDICGPTSWKIISVESNQAVNAKGSGNTSPDWQITGNHTVKLRAERSGNSGDRVYSITLQAKDESGNLSTPKVVTVTVPRSQGKGK
jgi:hypothetical protein